MPGPHSYPRNKAIQGVAQHLKRGTTNAEYIRSRLKDQHPGLFAQVVNGEITAAEAARRAGINKTKRRTSVYPDDINHTARVLKKHFDPDELYEAMKEANG